MEQIGDFDNLFIAGFGPIVADANASHRLYSEIMGIDFKKESGGYLHTEAMQGANSFALWPLSHARSPALAKLHGPMTFLRHRLGLNSMLRM